MGEPWRWGWVPEELPEFLEDRGWELVDDIAMRDAARAFLPPELAVEVNDPDRRIALSSTPEKVALATPAR